MTNSDKVLAGIEHNLFEVDAIAHLETPEDYLEVAYGLMDMAKSLIGLSMDEELWGDQ